MELLQPVIETARDFGGRLLELYSPEVRLTGRAAMLEGAARLDATVHDPLRAALERLRPQARWVTDDEERTGLDAGEWWAVDDIEGAVNLLHGRPEWGVSIALVRDGAPVLAVVHQPVGDRLYTATAGGGALLNGRPLTVSPKTAFADAIVETSQVGDEPAELQARIGRALGTLMGRALLVRTTIPTTFPLLALASGHSDVFWQYAPALTGVAAATLLVAEAGAAVTDLSGAPWRPGAPDLLVAAPGLHAEALAELRGLGATDPAPALPPSLPSTAVSAPAPSVSAPSSAAALAAPASSTSVSSAAASSAPASSAAAPSSAAALAAPASSAATSSAAALPASASSAAARSAAVSSAAAPSAAGPAAGTGEPGWR